MAAGRVRAGLEGRIICLEYTIFFLNVACWMLGAALFAVSTWIRFQDDFQEWVVELGFQQYWAGTWTLFAGAVLMMILGFVGCCATISETPAFLLTYVALTSACFIVNLGGAAYLLDNGIEYSKLTPWLEQTFLNLVSDYERDLRARRIMNMIQEYIGCCGSFGSDDYDVLGLAIPDECRDHVTGNIFGDGCYEVFAWYMETKTGWAAGIALLLGLFQLISIVSVAFLYSARRKQARRDAVLGTHG